MTTNKDYIRYIRGKVGHDLIFLNFAGGIVYNERNEILLQNGEIEMSGVYQVVLWNLENLLKKPLNEKYLRRQD